MPGGRVDAVVVAVVVVVQLPAQNCGRRRRRGRGHGQEVSAAFHHLPVVTDSSRVKLKTRKRVGKRKNATPDATPRHAMSVVESVVVRQRVTHRARLWGS